MNAPLNKLRHHVTGAIQRGEKTAIVAIEMPKEETFQASFTMPSRESAVAMVTAWGRRSLSGHSMGPRMDCGSHQVTLYAVKESDKQWIAQTANSLAQ